MQGSLKGSLRKSWGTEGVSFCQNLKFKRRDCSFVWLRKNHFPYGHMGY